MTTKKSYFNTQLAAQVVMGVLEELSPIQCIVIAARYCDSFEIEYMAELFEVSPRKVKILLIQGMEQINSGCSVYEIENHCKLCEINAIIIHKAFEIMFRLRKYQLKEPVSISMYNIIRKGVMNYGSR